MASASERLKKYREREKIISKLYQGPDAKPGETYTEFRKRTKKSLLFSVGMFFAIFCPLVL